MADWREHKLGELIAIKHGFAFKGEYFSDEPGAGPILVTPGNFAMGGGFKAAKPKFYTGEIPEGYMLRKGDLVVTMTDLSKSADTLGYGALVPGDATYLHNQRIGLVQILKPELLDKSFLHYALRVSEYRHHVVSGATGSTVKHTSPGRICEYRMPLPPLGEQQGIARVLGVLDDKIDVNRQISGAAVELSRAVYVDASQRGGEISELGKHVVLKYGKALRAPDRRPGDVPVFGCTGQVGWHESELTPGPGPVVGRKGANAGWVSWSPRSCWVIDTAFFVDIVSAYLSPEVAFLMLENANLPGLVGDSAVPGLNRDAAHRHVVRVPEQMKAREVTEKVRPLMVRSTQAQRESRALAALRDTLLPQLMSGKLRVRDAERIVEDAV